MFNAGISKLLKKGKKANLLYVASRLRTFILRVLHTWCPGPTSTHRPGTKFSRGWDQVKSAGDGIDRDFEMLPTPGPGPGLGKICRGRDFFKSNFENFWKFPETRFNVQGSNFFSQPINPAFTSLLHDFNVLSSIFYISPVISCIGEGTTEWRRFMCWKVLTRVPGVTVPCSPSIPLKENVLEHF